MVVRKLGEGRWVRSLEVDQLLRWEREARLGPRQKAVFDRMPQPQGANFWDGPLRGAQAHACLSRATQFHLRTHAASTRTFMFFEKCDPLHAEPKISGIARAWVWAPRFARGAL